MMRSILVVAVATMIVSTGCVDVTNVTAPEEAVEKAPTISLPPAVEPVLVLGWNQVRTNTVPFYAPSEGVFPEFDVRVENTNIAQITSVEVIRHYDPNCGEKCIRSPFIMRISVQGWDYGQTTVNYTLRSDPRVKGSFLVYVGPLG